MALNARELELIIIARDRASSTMARIGGALTIMGGGITALGVKWGREMTEMAMEAGEFSRDAALAFTQMFDKTGASVEEVNDMMARVARTTARPIEEIGEALFDVFSSIDASIPEAEKILGRVGQAAVAGQTDMRSAMIPTIAMMNAFQMGADQIDEILDLQFETVRRGIVTYEEFTQNIGKVIPAAKAAGQDISSMGSSYAFLTRQGLNASMAATSTARAFELMASPKSVANMEEIGIVVRDNQGEFLQMSDIISQLGQRFEGMTAPERKQAFEDIFGTARIQARRFFDVAIPNWREFTSLQETFQNSGNAMQEAYDVMFDEPLTKLQILQNRWELLRKEIGDRVIPILEERVAPIIERILDLWESLTDEQKDTVAEWLALGSVATSVLGALTTFIGIVTLAAGIWKAFGVGIATVASGAGVVLGVLAAVAAAAFLIWQNWDKIVEIWNNEVVPALQKIWDWLEPIIAALVDVATGAALDFWEDLKDAWNDLLELGREIVNRIDWEKVVEIWRRVWEKLAPIVETTFELIGAVIEAGFDLLSAIIEGTISVLTWIWENWGEEIVTILEGALEFLGGVLEGGLTILQGILTFFTGLFSGDWDKMVEGLKMIWEGMWLEITAFFEFIWTVITTIAGKVWQWFLDTLWTPFVEWLGRTWNDLWTNIKDFFTGIWEGIVGFFEGVLTGIKDFWETIWSAVAEFFHTIWESDIVKFGRNIFGILYHTVRIIFTLVWEVWKRIWTRVKEFFQSSWESIKTTASRVWNTIKGIAAVVWTAVKNVVINPILILVGWLATKWGQVRETATRIWNDIKAKASVIWQNVKFVIMGPINVAKSLLSTRWNEIKGTARTKWEEIKSTASTVWNNLKDAIMDPIRDAVSGVSGFVNDIIGHILRLWDKAQEYATKIHNILKKLDPREWFSPPITQVVAAGFKVLNDQVVGDLQNMEREANNRVGNIRDKVADLSRAREDLKNLTTRASGMVSGSTNYKVDIHTAAQSPSEVANELAWKLKLS